MPSSPVSSCQLSTQPSAWPAWPLCWDLLRGQAEQASPGPHVYVDINVLEDGHRDKAKLWAFMIVRGKPRVVGPQPVIFL